MLIVFTCNRQKLETVQMSIVSRMKKLITLYSYNDTPHSNENKHMTVKDNDMDECHNQNVEQKPETKEYTVCDAIYLKLKIKQNSFMIL